MFKSGDVLAIATVGALALVAGVAARRAGSPKVSKGLTGYSIQQIWRFYVKALNAGNTESALLWYDEFIAKGGDRNAADVAMMTSGRSAPQKAPMA